MADELEVDAEARAAHIARVRALPLAQIQVKLMAWAMKTRGMAKDVAQDVFQMAFIKLAQARPEKWDHEKDPEAYRFLVRKMKAIRKAQREREVARRTDLDTDGVEESPPSSDRGPARAAIRKEAAAQAKNELLREVAGSPLAVRIIETVSVEGALKPAELAERLGEPIKDVYWALRRISRAQERIEGGGEEEGAGPASGSVRAVAVEEEVSE
jgi:DNA-directed RNA polymerase specialized sigma24 family protein